MGGGIGAAKCLLVFGKAHIKGHYRTDPRTARKVYVQPYDDKRQTVSGEQSASQPASAMPEVPTVKLNNGREVAAKLYEGELVAITYANRTQAERKREELGDGWEVVGGTGLIRPFYVAKVLAEGAKEVPPHEPKASEKSDTSTIEHPDESYPPPEVLADYTDLQPKTETPPPAASQLPIQAERRTGREGSAYEGDDLAALLGATQKEQRGRFLTMQTLRGTLAHGTHPTTGRPLTPKQREELEQELADLEKEYEGVYEQVEQAAGDQDARHLRERAEQPEKPKRHPSDQLSLFKRLGRGLRLFFTRTVGGKTVVVAPHMARHAKRADWTKPIGTSRDVSLDELNAAIRRGDQVCQEDCAGQAARLEILLQPHVYKVWQKLNTKDAGSGYRFFPRVRRVTNAKYGDGYVFEWVHQEPGQETVIPWNAVRDDYFSHQPGTAWNGVGRETIHRFVDDLYMIARGYVSDEIVDSEFMQRAARAGLRVLVRRDLPPGFEVGDRLERPSGEQVTVIGGRQDLDDPTHYLLVKDERGQVSELSSEAVTSGRVQRLQKALGRAWLLLFSKAHVRSYQRTTASGQVVTVREHDDKRRAAHEDPAAGRRHRQEDPASGRQDPRQPVQPTQRTALGTPFNAVEPPEPGRLDEWLHMVNREPDIQQAMREVLEGTSTRQLYRQGDGSYTPERAQLHESIVASMLNPRAVAQEGQRPQVCILLGAPASGKTTALQPAARELGVEFTVINADDVKEKLPEYNGRNAGLVHEESSDIAEGLLLPRALGARHHLCLDITGVNGKKVMAMVDQFHMAGYDISILYVHLPLEKAAARAVGRFRETGRFVPPDYVVHKVDGGPEQTYNALKNDPRISHWRRYNTDVEKGAQPVRQEIGRRDTGPRVAGAVAKSVARDGGLAGLRGHGRVPERHHSQEPPDLQQHAPSVAALLEQASAVRADLLKALVHLDISLQSPDLDSDGRGVLLAERLHLLRQIEAMDARCRQVEVCPLPPVGGEVATSATVRPRGWGLVFRKGFAGHRGRPGLRGGSLPRRGANPGSEDRPPGWRPERFSEEEERIQKKRLDDKAAVAKLLARAKQEGWNQKETETQLKIVLTNRGWKEQQIAVAVQLYREALKKPPQDR